MSYRATKTGDYHVQTYDVEPEPKKTDWWGVITVIAILVIIIAAVSGAGR